MTGEIVSTHIKATENTTVSKLGVFDMIKLLFQKFSNSDEAELNAAEKMSSEQLKARASLRNLFNNAGKEMDKNNADKVTLQLSSKYIPYIDDICDSVHGMGRYYDFEIHKKNLPINVEYKFVVIMKKRVS